MRPQSAPGRLVAFIGFCSPKGPVGPVLFADGPLRQEVYDRGRDLSDHAFQTVPTLKGIVIFEGWLETSSDPDPDVTFVGEWRRLTHWEMCQVHAGFSPWNDVVRNPGLEVLYSVYRGS